MPDSINPRQPTPRKSIVICSTGRSGSTLLAKTLKDTNCLGSPQEYFDKKNMSEHVPGGNLDELRAYIDKVFELGTTSNGVFSVKLHRAHFEHLVRLLRQDPSFRDKTDFQVLASVFPEPVLIYIYRRNLTKQAISVEIANQTGVWVKNRDNTESGGAPREQPVFRPLAVYRNKKIFRQRNRQWKQFFLEHSLEYFEIVYEDFITSFHQTIKEMIEFTGENVGVSVESIKIPTVKQGNSTNTLWYKKYNAQSEFVFMVLVELQQIPKSTIRFLRNLKSILINQS